MTISGDQPSRKFLSRIEQKKLISETTLLIPEGIAGTVHGNPPYGNSFPHFVSQRHSLILGAQPPGGIVGEGAKHSNLVLPFGKVPHEVREQSRTRQLIRRKKI